MCFIQSYLFAAQCLTYFYGYARVRPGSHRTQAPWLLGDSVVLSSCCRETNVTCVAVTWTWSCGPARPLTCPQGQTLPGQLGLLAREFTALGLRLELGTIENAKSRAPGFRGIYCLSPWPHLLSSASSNFLYHRDKSPYLPT